MTPSFHALDFVIVAAYVLLIIWIGLRLWRRSSSDAEEYILAGRGLTLPAFVMTLVTTWYGGILGVGEYTYRFGLANWFVFGLPYYVAAALFALFFASRAQRTRFRNLPDQLAHAYGPRVARAGSLVVLLMTLPAAYVLMLGVLGSTIFGVDLGVAVVVGTLVSVAYVYLGGFRSVIRTDALQFLLMYGGFVVLLVVLWQSTGSPAEIWSQLPETHRHPSGGQSVWDILVWYFIALAAMIEPTFYQRCYAARDAATARRGVFVSIGFWFVFDILTTLTGLYAVALYPNLSEPVSTYPQLATDFLAPGLRGLFWITLLAVVMSTVDSYTFVAAVTLGRDLWLGSGHRRGDGAELRASRFALPIVAVLAMVFALYFRSVVDIWYVFGTVGTPALLLPVLTSFSERRRFTARGALFNIVLAGGTSLAWEIARGSMGTGSFPLAVPAIYPGLMVSVVIWISSGGRRARLNGATPGRVL